MGGERQRQRDLQCLEFVRSESSLGVLNQLVDLCLTTVFSWLPASRPVFPSPVKHTYSLVAGIIRITILTLILNPHHYHHGRCHQHCHDHHHHHNHHQYDDYSRIVIATIVCLLLVILLLLLLLLLRLIERQREIQYPCSTIQNTFTVYVITFATERERGGR